MNLLAARQIATLLLVFLTLVTHPLYAVDYNEKNSIKRILDQKMRLDGIPGLSFAVVENGELTMELSLGMSNIEHATDTSSETVFRSASLVKPMTATAILQLSAQKKIDLDTPVWEYCLDFPEKKHPVSSRDLLTHTSGVRSYNMPWSQYEAELFSTRRYKSVTDALSIFAADPLIHEPGSAFKYSSYGYNLLGCVIESVSGDSYIDYLRKHIFNPAGMFTTHAANTGEIVLNRAGTYRRGKKGRLTNERYVDLSNKIPSGGLLTTASDLARFSIAYMDGTLLAEPTMRQSIVPTVLNDNSISRYAMGWELTKVPDTHQGHEMYHNGSTPGVSGIMYLFPGTKSALVLLANLYGVDQKEELMHNIADILDLRLNKLEENARISSLSD